MIKTVALAGSELKVEGLNGFNTFVQNLGSGVIYASKYPGVAAGADNVAEIPAGGGKLISTTNGTVYLLGTGKAELTGLDSDGIIAAGGAAIYSTGGGGGSGNSGASLAELMSYADAQDEATLNAAKAYAESLVQDKADRSELPEIPEIPEIPTSLPANGGNADTVGGFTVGCNVPANAVFTDTVVDISGKLNAANPAATGTFSLNRKANTTVGDYSFAAGNNCEASGTYSFAAGDKCTASGTYSWATGFKCIAAGYSSQATGYSSEATGKFSYASGDEAKASGECSHAYGDFVKATGDWSHAEGEFSVASGDYSHAEGAHTTASGYCSCAEGAFTTASNLASMACGKYNKAMTNDPNNALSSSAGDVFVIGNGTGSNKLSNAFRVTYKGEVYGVGAFNTSGADYAEFIKPWFDDNPDGEDRVGFFVTIKDGKLRFAEPGDYIVGITSGNPSVVGNGDEDWLGRWQRDDFNRIITEDGHFKANPDYDPSVKYVERKDRPEWDYVGMIGVLPLRDDGTCVPGGFAKCGTGGVATAADEWECHRTFFVVERVSENVIAVEMR